MIDLPNKTHLSPDGAVVNDDGDFVLPNTITAKTIIKLNKRLRGAYRETIPLSGWLKQPTLFGLPIVESDQIKDPGEIKFGDFSGYIRRGSPMTNLPRNPLRPDEEC